MSHSKKAVVFHMGPVWTVIKSDPSGEVADILKEKLREQKTGARYSNISRFGGWDGYVNFYSSRHGFPTGLCSIAKRCLDELGYEAVFQLSPSITRAPIFKPFERIGGDKRILRPHQVKGADIALRCMRANLGAATGAGKTLLGAEIVRRTGYHTLWMCNRKSLAQQTRDELQSWLGIPVGLVMGGEADVTGKELLVVGVVQSLILMPPKHPFWNWIDLLIIDECHNASQNTWYEISKRAAQAWYRVGLSGTPKTGDPFKDLKLQAATGPMKVIPGAGIQDMIAKGIDAAPKLKIVRISPEAYPHINESRDAGCPDWRENSRLLRKAGGAVYRHAYSKGIIHNRERNEAICSIIRKHIAANQRILTLISKTEHGDLLQEMIKNMLRSFPRASSYYLYSGVKMKERTEYVQNFRTAKHGSSLLSSPLFDTGMDVPEIDVEIDAGGGNSLIGINQRLGRAVRAREDKSEVIVYNFVDGFSSMERPHKKDHLMKHSLQRIEEYKRKGFEVEIVKIAGNAPVQRDLSFT